eukprot:494282_1
MFSLFSRLDSRKLCSFILALVLLASTCDGFLNLHNKPHEIAHFASFTSNYSGSFHQNPEECRRRGVYIESSVHQSATPTQVESNRDRIDFHHDTEESLDGFVIHAFGDSIMQDVIMYQSVQDWISITNATFDTMSVRNDATRASCGVVWIVIAITVFAFLLPTSFASRCPNDRFKMVASHHDSFTLNFIYEEMHEAHTFNRYYIAFGRDDKWTLTLVDPKIGGEFVSFKCKENQLGSVEIIGEKTLHTEYTHKDPICCAASYLLDGEDRNHVVEERKQNEAPVAGPNGPPGVAVNPLQFPVMPGSFALQILKKERYLEHGHTATTEIAPPRRFQPESLINEQHFFYYRYKSPTSRGPSPAKSLVQDSGAFLKWAILQMTEAEFERLSTWKPLSWSEQVAKSGTTKSKGLRAAKAVTDLFPVVEAAGVVYNFIQQKNTDEQPRIYAPARPLSLMIPNTILQQQCSSSTACDTGIVNDLAVFIIECARRPRGVVWWDDITKIKFAYSGDGIFN